MLEVRPPVISSVMGLFPPVFVQKMRERGIAWFATVTTVGEARAAEAAGANAIVAQGAEAGGRRRSFDAAAAQRKRGLGFSAAVTGSVGCDQGAGSSSRRDCRWARRRRGTNARRERCAVWNGLPSYRKPRSIPCGQTHSPKRRRGADGEPVSSAVARAVVLPMTMFLLQPGRMPRNLLLIPCNAVSPLPCKKPPRRKETSAACRLGQVNRQSWREPSPRRQSCDAFRKRCKDPLGMIAPGLRKRVVPQGSA